MSEELPLKKLGEYLVCSAGRLQNAVKKQAQIIQLGQSPRRIGEILLENGDITDDELQSAIRKQRVARLKQCPVFNMLTPTELAAIATRFQEVSVAAGKQFIIQDDPDPTLYIMATGKVEVYRTNLDGTHVHFAYAEPPEPIGEMGYFTDGKRTASVRAVEDTELLQADYASLTHYFEHVPRVALAFTKIVEQRRRANEEIILSSKS